MTQTAAAEETKRKKTTATRPYIVLEEFVADTGQGLGTLYRQAGTFMAGTAEAASEQARQKHTDGAPHDVVAYVAIPAGNFNRKAPTVETKTVVKWS